MHVSKKQLFSLIFFIVLLLALPVAVFLVQKRQDIRPRALQGQANLLLSSDKNSSSVGESINVLVTMQLLGSGLQVSGVDFMILYDKEKLDVLNITPSLQNVIAGGFFTEAPVVTSGGKFDDTYNFLRVVEVAKTANNNLPIGSLSLANIIFRSVGEGSAVVKFPEDNKYIEIVGTGMMPPVGPSGMVGWWKMESDSDVVAQQVSSQSVKKQPESAQEYVQYYKSQNYLGVFINHDNPDLLDISGTVINIDENNLKMSLKFIFPDYLKEKFKNALQSSNSEETKILTVNLGPDAQVYDSSDNQYKSSDHMIKTNKKLMYQYIGKYITATARLSPAGLIVNKMVLASIPI